MADARVQCTEGQVRRTGDAVVCDAAVCDAAVCDAVVCDALAFGPHPDDIELGCGGTLIKLVDLGYSTVLVDMTRGEMSTRGTAETRAAEAVAAAKVLGASARENLGCRTKEPRRLYAMPQKQRHHVPTNEVLRRT